MNPTTHQHDKADLRAFTKASKTIERASRPVQDILVRSSKGLMHPDLIEHIDHLHATLSMVVAGITQLPHVKNRAGPLAKDDRRETDEDRPRLSGRFPEFGLSFAMQWLASEYMTGSLQIDTPGEAITIAFHRGQIVGAFTDRMVRGERLGELLIEQGEISHDRLIVFMDLHQGASGLLGITLVENNIISQGALAGALREQLHKRLNRVMDAKSGGFAFFQVDVGEQTGLRADVKGILAERGATSAWNESQ